MGHSVRRRMRKRRPICRESALRRFIGIARAPRGRPWVKFGREKGDAISSFAFEAFTKGVVHIAKGTVLSELELTSLVDDGTIGRWVESLHEKTIVKTEIGCWDEEGNRIKIAPSEIPRVSVVQKKGNAFRDRMASANAAASEGSEKISAEADLTMLIAEMVASGNILSATEARAELAKRAEKRAPKVDPMAKLKAHHARMDSQKRRKGCR